MTKRVFFENVELEFKKVRIEQYDYYDSEDMDEHIHRYSVRIGSLLIVFTELEQTLDDCLSSMIDPNWDDIGYTIFMDMSYGQKIELYNRLTKKYLNMIQKPDQVKKLKECIDSLKSAGRVRNLVAHAKWMSLDKGGFVRSKATLDDEAYIEFGYYRLRPKELYKLERKIGKTNNRLSNFHDRNEIF